VISRAWSGLPSSGGSSLWTDVRPPPTAAVRPSRLTRGARRSRICRLNSILLVEGHDEVRAALRDWLHLSLGTAQLREARNLQEALDQTAKTMPDVVLINLELPGLNGIEATRELRRRCPECPVVIMSVNDSEVLRSAALGAGAAAFVSKRELPHGLLPILGRIL